MKYFIVTLLLTGCFFTINPADITISVDATADRKPISPWLYGRNNSLSDNPKKPVTAASLKLYREAGLRMLRENSGNNATKYNWRKKLSSHPDWYNNVYSHDWDYQARVLQDSLPETQGFMALQLLGKVAANSNHNFNDWSYNGSAGWSGCHQNLAGGGSVNPAGGDSALVEGDAALYLEDWPADSTTGILDHWFGQEGVGLDKQRFLYWNMDNEPEIWAGTHDDAVPQGITAEEFMQRYFAVAKSARRRFPEIKITGFVACNEWQWYSWNNALIKVTENGSEKRYVWAEYFIKRIAEEQQATGIRLLDVMDFHFYPQTQKDPALTLQLHRVWFDTAWEYPKANGCKLLGGGWDESSKKEYIMERCSQWLNQYMGAGHNIGFGVSECGKIHAANPNVVAAWYASQIGTFANHGVELFTPWEWYTGMWEVLHLFSRYGGTINVSSTSSNDTVVSAYSSVSAEGNAMTVMLVNRDQTVKKTVAVTINGFSPSSSTACSTLTLYNLPADSETFIARNQNALVKGDASMTNGTVTLELPALSVTALLLRGTTAIINRATRLPRSATPEVRLRGSSLHLSVLPSHSAAPVALYALDGRRVYSITSDNVSAFTVSLSHLPQGRYIIDIGNGRFRKALLLLH